jgi:signal transduction histidine kinase
LTGLGFADAAHEARLLSRIIETISTGLDLDAIVQGVAALITETTESDVCFVHLLDDSGQRLQLRGATPPFDALAGRIELAVGEGVAGWVAAHGEPVVIFDNKLADHRYKYIPALRGEDFTSLASVPVTAPTGHLVGVLNVHTRRRREFTDVDVQILGTVAGLMAGAIENARLHRRLADREEALERFAERVVQGQEMERRRLAGDIHDGISQRIVSLCFHLSAAADALPHAPVYAAGQIARAQRLAEAALDETRFAIAGLRPPVLDDLGLSASLESLALSMPNLDVRVDAPPCQLPEHVETAFYRIAQEALQNIVKHAGARTATIRLTVEPGAVALTVEDDGQGFDPVAVAARAGPTYGLAGMRERAELLGGELALHSRVGEGTTLRLTVPLRTSSSP